MLALITHDKSGKSTSMADLFAHICERKGVGKRIFLYQQRRFAKLGKAASSIVNALPVLRQMLDETENTNLLVESCKLYVSSEFFVTELCVLAYFNQWVTFPFLHYIEKSTQEQLLKTLPKLYDDLLQRKVDTLESYMIQIHGITISEPSDELSRKIIGEMCISAAAAIKLQCGREYGFSDVETPRTTVLTELSSSQLEGLPTNNLVAERDFSKFDRLARNAKSRNRKFTAKGIRDNMTFYKLKQIKIEKTTRKISSIFKDQEKNLNETPKKKLKEKIETKLQKGRKAKNYTVTLLQTCKSWGGPCTSANELQNVLRNRPDSQQRVVRTELAYLAHTNKLDKMARSDLYRLNGITHEKRLVNLAILLEDDDFTSTATVVNLPTNDEVVAAAFGEGIQNPTDHEINDMCIVVWLSSSNEYQWYLAYVTGKPEESRYLLDHLHRVDNTSDALWAYPSKEDVQVAHSDQILSCNLVGEWDMKDPRKIRFIVKNTKHIVTHFNKYRD